MPDLVLQPGTDGAALELTERQKRLIQLQHPDAARVVVKELHSGGSAAALERPSRRVLQTVGLDGNGQPAEPTLTKLDAAAALVEEVARHDGVAKTLGACAGRILRRPLYLRDPRIAAAGAFSASEHEDADAALVLELPGACWALPEFAGASTGEQIITPLHSLVCEAVAEGKPSDCATIDESLDELCAPSPRTPPLRHPCRPPQPLLPAARRNPTTCRPPPSATLAAFRPPRAPCPPPAARCQHLPPAACTLPTACRRGCPPALPRPRLLCTRSQPAAAALCPPHAGTRRAARCVAWPPAAPRAPSTVRRRRAAGSLARSTISAESRRRRSPPACRQSS